MTILRPYDKDDNYYFLHYRLYEKGHPEYIEMLREKDELPHPNYDGVPRWVRVDFVTSYELMFYLNSLINSPYPNRVEDIQIHSDEQLSKIISVGVKTNEDGEKEYFRIWEHDEGYEEGEKMTLREFKFGSHYSKLSEYYKSNPQEYPVMSNF